MASAVYRTPAGGGAWPATVARWRACGCCNCPGSSGSAGPWGPLGRRCVAPSTVTKMLQRLQRTGNVTRTTDPADRRAVLVEATETSRALRPEIEAAWKTVEQRTVAGLDPAERAELQRLLEKLAVNFLPQDVT